MPIVNNNDLLREVVELSSHTDNPCELLANFEFDDDGVRVREALHMFFEDFGEGRRAYDAIPKRWI
jgi:hypothetical protein